MNIIDRNNDFPDIYMDGMKELNPYIHSPNAPYAIFFYQTRETLFGDADTFKKFLDNAIARFRCGRAYTDYKSYLYDLGLNHCQVLSSIDSTMADIEMHHNGMTIFDVAMIITGHLLSTNGKVCTFDVIRELKKVHRNNMVPLVMLCKSIHQLNHDNAEFFIPASMTFGCWPELLKNYSYGITYGVAKKLYHWIKISLEQSFNKEYQASLIGLRDTIEKWSEYNEYCSGNKRTRNSIRTPIITYNY